MVAPNQELAQNIGYITAIGMFIIGLLYLKILRKFQLKLPILMELAFGCWNCGLVVYVATYYSIYRQPEILVLIGPLLLLVSLIAVFYLYFYLLFKKK